MFLYFFPYVKSVYVWIVVTFIIVIIKCHVPNKACSRHISSQGIGIMKKEMNLIEKNNF